MKKRYWALGLVASAGLGAGALALLAMPKVHEGNTGDAPQLAKPGEFSTGTQSITFELQERVSFTEGALVTGQVDIGPRALDVRVWYPLGASPSASAEPTNYPHDMSMPGGEGFRVSWEGRSFEGDTAIADGAYPLVIISHGFGGWNTQMSNLAEHIASRGYVVASIAHGDMPITGIPSFLTSFGNVLLSRSLDQQGVIREMLAQQAEGSSPISSAIDPTRIAVVGYSMGGYGAITTAGASLNFEEGPAADLPSNAVEALGGERPLAAEEIDAVVLIAPWGGQSDNRAWAEGALSQVEAPSLVIVGSQDDVVGYEDGVRWIFDNLSQSERHMLVYQNARHNIVGNAFEPAADTPFAAIEFLTEPVWRGERINSINEHFITAFLDLHLKDDAEKAGFLSMPTEQSNESNWPTSPGEQLNGAFAGPEQSGHWRGFQRRWAVGLEFYSQSASSEGESE